MPAEQASERGAKRGLGGATAALAAGLLSLGLAGLSLGPLSEAPFSPSERRPGPWGDGSAPAAPVAATAAENQDAALRAATERPPRPRDLTRAFHGADYLIDIARAHLAVAAGGDEEAGAKAAGLLREAIGRRPADAYAWTLLAVAETDSRRPEHALGALRRSARFAPYLLRLARLRVRVAGQHWRLLGEGDRETLARDLATVRDFDPRDFGAVLDANRRLTFFARERGLIE